MRALLTSDGLTTPRLKDALDELCLGRSSTHTAAFIPTAAWPTAGDKGWLVDNLRQVKTMCRSLDVVEPSLLPESDWFGRLEAADLIVVGGGDAAFLLARLHEAGGVTSIRTLAAERVYVGISAGSVVAGPDIEWLYDLHGREVEQRVDALNLAQVAVLPHRDTASVNLQRWTAIASDLPYSAHHLDDGSAVRLCDGDITLIEA